MKAVCFVTLIAAYSIMASTPPVFAQPSAPVAEAFQFREAGEKSLELREGDRRVLVYNFGELALPGEKTNHLRSSYVCPIYGLDGEVLTDDFPKDHIHHHGLFWGWPHVKVGAREYDFWKMLGVRIEFQRWLARETNADGATLAVENGWFAGDKQLMNEIARLQVHPATQQGRRVDVELVWTPLEAPITLGGAEGKSYGGLSLRFAPRTDTKITVPSGVANEDLLITRLPWADMSARFKDAPATSGIALFVAPSNRDFPPEWMTRDYGLLAVGWPGVRSQTLAAGEPVTCRYRLWIHRGAPDAAEIQKQYDAYCTELAEVK